MAILMLPARTHSNCCGPSACTVGNCMESWGTCHISSHERPYGLSAMPPHVFLCMRPALYPRRGEEDQTPMRRRVRRHSTRHHTGISVTGACRVPFGETCPAAYHDMTISWKAGSSARRSYVVHVNFRHPHDVLTYVIRDRAALGTGLYDRLLGLNITCLVTHGCAVVSHETGTLKIKAVLSTRS